MTERVAVQFTATADFGALSKQITALNDQLAKTNEQYAATGMAGTKAFSGLGRQFEQTLSGLKGWESQTVSVRSGVAKLTDDIKNQGYTIQKFMTSPIQGVKKAWQDAGIVADEQVRLQKSRFVEMGRSANGMVSGQFIKPTGDITKLASSEELARARAAAFNAELKSTATNLIRTGKEAQWAGRQLTYGISVPIALIGGLVGKLAFDLQDQENKLRAVYGGIGEQSQKSLDQVSKASENMSLKVAQQFGIAGKATMQLEAQLAGMGYTGTHLQTAVYEVSRLQALAAKGTVAQGDAINAAINLMNNFDIPVSRLRDVFNHLNAAENTTVLATNDIVTALPRAGQAVSALGGSWQDLVVLMAGMRAAGIPAAQAATALNRSLGSIVSPSQTAIKALDAVHVNIQRIIQDNTQGGQTSIVGIFRELGVQLKGLTGDQQLAAINTLFSKFQGTRIFTAMRGLVDQTGKIGQQMKAAMDAVDSSSGSAAANAAKDIQNRFDTPIGHIRRAIATIGVELSLAGKPFLTIGADILGVLTKIIHVFTSLPNIVKNITAGGLLFVAITGPIVMLSGLLRQLFGQFLKGAAALTGWKLGLKEVKTQEDYLNEINIGLNENLSKQVSTLEEVTAAVMQLSTAYSKLAQKQETVAVSGLPTTAASRAMAQSARAKAQSRIPAGQPGAGQFISVNSAAESQLANDTEKVATNTERFTSGLSKAAPLVGTVALGTGILLSNAHGVAGEIGKWAIPLSFIVPIVPILIKGFTSLVGKIREAVAAMGALDVAQGISNVENEATGLTKVFAGLSSSTGVWGLAIGAVAVAATGLFVMMHRDSENALKDQQAMANGAETLAHAVGAAWTETNTVITSTGESIQSAGNMIADAQKTVNNITSTDAGKRLINQIKSMNDSDVLGTVKGYGLQLAIGGATPKQVHDAMQALFYAAGKYKYAFDANLTHIKFHNVQQLIDQQKKQFEKELNTAFSKIRVMPNPFLAVGQMTPQLKTIGEKVGQTLASGTLNPLQQRDLTQQWLDYFTNLEKNLRTKIAAAQAAGNSTLAGSLTEQLRQVGAAYKVFATSVGNKFDPGQHITGLVPIIKALDIQLGDAAAQGNAAAGGINNTANAAQKLKNAVNGTDITSFMSNFQSALSSNIGQAVSYVDTQYQNMAQAAQNSVDKQQQAEDHSYAMRSKAATTFYNYLASQAGKGYNVPKKAALDLFNSEIKGNQNVAKARKAAEDLVNKYNKGSETSIKRVTDRYNKQIDAIKTRSSLEQKAAAQQQKEFQQQQQEADRLAQQQNLNIDFNTALYSGNLGQAAQDMAQAQADETKNALDDAQKAAADKAAADKTAADQEIAQLTKVRDHKIKALKAEDNARKVWLQNELSDATKAYDHEKTLNDNRLQAYKNSLSQSYALQQTLLDRQLATITASVPTTKTQMNNMFTAIQNAAHGYGLNLSTQSQGWYDTVSGTWTRSIHDAATKVQNDNAWKTFGSKIAKETTAGIGMNWNEFVKFLKTGNPKFLPDTSSGSGGSGSGSGGSGNPGDGPTRKPHPVPFSHSGEYIRGDGKQGVKSDETVRVLQHGEYVMQRDAVKKYGAGTFEALNSMKMHSGGFVGPLAIMASEMMAGVMRGLISNGIKNAFNTKQIKMGAAAGGGGAGGGGPFVFSGGGGSLFSGGTFAGLDQGVDWTGRYTMRSPDKMKITRVDTNSGWIGGTLIAGQFLGGPNKGRYAYFAEAIRPAQGLHAGSVLNKGGLIGTVNSSYPGSESGFAQNAYGAAYGNTQEGKGGNAPDPQAVAFANYIGVGRGGGGAPTAPGIGPGPHALRQYIPAIKTALAAAHLPITAAYVNAVLHRISVEDSGGIKGKVNKWDSNWKAGTPSVGLMQVTGPTFYDNAGPYKHTGPFKYNVSTNPTANIYAGIEHALHAWSKPFIDVMYQTGGYDNGGIWKSGTLGVNKSGKPEVVFTNAQWRELSQLNSTAANMVSNSDRIGSGDTYHIHVDINGGQHLNADHIANRIMHRIKLEKTKNERVVGGR